MLGSLAAGGVAVLAWRRRASETARVLALIAVGIVVVQTALNVVAATIGDPVWASSPHLLVGSLLWLTMLGVAASAWGSREVVTSDRSSVCRHAKTRRHSGRHRYMPHRP